MSKTRELFGKRLRQLRQQKFYSQEKLAELADVTPDQISLMERGKSAASFETLDGLAHALKVSIKDLFDFEKLPKDG